SRRRSRGSHRPGSCDNFYAIFLVYNSKGYDKRANQGRMQCYRLRPAHLLPKAVIVGTLARATKEERETRMSRRGAAPMGALLAGISLCAALLTGIAAQEARAQQAPSARVLFRRYPSRTAPQVSPRPVNPPKMEAATAAVIKRWGQAYQQ